MEAAWVMVDDSPVVTAVALAITKACNARCIHCFRSDWDCENICMPRELIRNVVELVRKLGPDSVRITGGEPTLYAALPELVAELADTGGRVSVVTNGADVPPEMLQSFAANRLGRLYVTILSGSPTRHDGYTRVRGSLERAAATVRKALELGIDTRAYYPVLQAELDEVLGTIRMLDDLGVVSVTVIRPIMVGRWRVFGDPPRPAADWNALWREVMERRTRSGSLLEVQGLRDSNQPASCTALPLRHLNIDTDGDGYPCCIMNGMKRFRVGNIGAIEEGGVLHWYRELSVCAAEKFGATQQGCVAVADRELGCPLNREAAPWPSTAS